MDTRDVDAIADAVVDRLLKRFEPASSTAFFPLYSTRQVAAIFGVSPNTVLAWRRDRLLKGRIHLQSGRDLRWVFTQKDVMDFLIANFPDPDTDFGSPY